MAADHALGVVATPEPRCALIARSCSARARPAAVPPVRRLLRRQRADVLSARRVPRRRRRTCCSGEIGGTPFYIGGPQFEYWQHTHLIIDVVPGRGGMFSLEGPRGLRFLTRSRPVR